VGLEPAAQLKADTQKKLNVSVISYDASGSHEKTVT
jgi:hypothetical protein